MRTRRILVVFCVLTLVLCQAEVEPETKVLSKYKNRKYNPAKIEDASGLIAVPMENDTMNNQNFPSEHQNGSYINLSEESTETELSRMGKPRGKPSERDHMMNVTIGKGICQSTDMRNFMVNIWILQDCEVIEGYLQISLMHKTHDGDFDKVSFPKLREITGYLLLYRVNALKSLANLFPNLEVIRGDILMTDYALVIYEMPHLQEIGLKKLIQISRGGVRIELNPALCFAKTINWDKIVASSADNFIKNNIKEDSCPGCSQCKNGNCWSSKHCQEMEKPKCHHTCMGYCSGPTDRDCYVCKHYRHEGRCLDQCPPHLYVYLSRRCITKEDCLDMNEQRKKSLKLEHTEGWRPFKGHCRTQCPDGYEDNDTHNATTCVPCNGRCQKVMAGATVRNIADAQRFEGITVIRGALEFEINNGNRNITKELTKFFGQIEEITEYLKIVHSFPITTLSFMKGLKLIRGERLDINNSSLVIMDNPNLSNLFPKNQKIEIKKGRLFFHYNPKLCFSKIEELGHMVNITNFTKVEVQPESNGEKVACDIVNINIAAKNFNSTAVNITWDSYRPREGQHLLSYLLNYIETEYENITMESNACGYNTWHVKDVNIPNANLSEGTVTKEIVGLKPYTKYAVYVKTYTLRSENTYASPVGQSNIAFFRTESDVPSVPTRLTSSAVSDSEILVKWGPPEYPNGPIGYYLLAGFIRLDDPKILNARDYCRDGLNDEVEEVEPPEITEKPIAGDPQSCCAMENQSKTGSSRAFGVYCQENITISYLSPGRKDYCQRYNRYNVATTEMSDLIHEVSLQESGKRAEVIDDTKTRIHNGSRYFGTYDSFVFNVSATNTSYLLKKLRHFSLYTISLAACGYVRSNGVQMCSPMQYTNARTAKRESADDLGKLTVSSNSTTVSVFWDKVEEPNGLTVAYKVEYINLDVKDIVKSTDCITAEKFERDKVYSMGNLSPGKYSINVRSVSLAGDGKFSEPISFTIVLEENSSVGLKIGLTFGVLILVAITGFCFAYRRRQRKMKQIRLIASVNPDYIETKYIVDDWEVPRENVEILEELGLGNFGMVYRGRLNGTTEVAIKTISESVSQREKNEFLNEASVMKNFSTFHIIELLGVVSVGNPPFVIMELMENGDLKTYLRKIRDTHLVPDTSRVIRMAAEIADGMAYLESKKFVHRDLAARNCMVSKDLVCKIGDFGMARDIYETDYYKIGKKGLLPIRWMSPENLSDGVFTSDSDVWSYGVVLYEILTMAEIPYQGFSNEEVLNYVLRKGTLNIPRNCPENIFKIMEKCFKWRPNDRPTFMEIVAELEPFLGQDFCETSFYHSANGVEIRRLGIKKVYHNAAPIRFHLGNENARWVKDFEDNVTLLDQTKAGTSRGRIFKNGFQHFGDAANMESVPLDR